MVFYVGYYNADAIRREARIVAPASENKMGYIQSALREACGEPIEIVTPAETRLHRYIRGRRILLCDRTELKTFSTFSSRFKLLRGLGHLWTRTRFVLYLLKHLKPEDHLIVYHSLAYMRLFKLIKRIKGCALTIEVEEIYADVKENEALKKKELASLQTADSYIFITELLREKVNREKPAVISHGTYRPLPDHGFRFDDDRIHVVYAGTFCKIKGGAYAAIAAAEYLDERYTLEILGGGGEEDTAAVQERIREVSAKTKCRINYAGYKSGADFDSYIQACHIGLSTQQPDGTYNATSFPSKVLMYMSNGLRVVSVRIPAIETSAVGDRIYYYDKQDPKEIARAIRSVALDDGYDSRAHLNVLHRDFVEELKRLLNG